MIVVCTAVLGVFDYLRSPEVIEPGVRYICFADQPIAPCAPWEIQPAATFLASAARNSRMPKILPHLHFDADYSIWHDANFCLKRKPNLLIDMYLWQRDVAMFAHPCRDTVEREANVLLEKPAEFPGVDMDAVRSQVTRWKHAGAPDGLWCGGLIIRRHNLATQAFNERWWQEYAQGCSRDQLALPMARAFCGTEIETIPGDVYNNPIMAFHWHAAWRDKAENRPYQTVEAEYRMRRDRLKEICAR